MFRRVIPALLAFGATAALSTTLASQWRERRPEPERSPQWTIPRKSVTQRFDPASNPGGKALAGHRQARSRLLAAADLELWLHPGPDGCPHHVWPRAACARSQPVSAA